MATEKNCSACGKTLDTSGYPLWCKACRSKDRRERERAAEARTFASGAEAMRRQILEAMRCNPASGLFRLVDITVWIGSIERPELPEPTGQEPVASQESA